MSLVILLGWRKQARQTITTVAGHPQKTFKFN